ncbi:hypothetical protein [Kaistella faecalis]|uniref:hypothetical protein n=1 Tax=Kaistella faecalis TaxID=2852098 RepID=UPI001C450311|nr:hypothetical protein [Chryseobacterium faecale]UFK97711.1 hypothetical protein LL667_12230 [Chryseobacterium faecale]
MEQSFTRTFNKIFVIESLDESDSKTGKMLFDDIISRLAKYGDGSFTCEYLDISNRAEFDDAMIKIAIECGRGVKPILHLEIHGSELGLKLKNGDLIPYPILAMQLSILNRGCKNNLFLTMAVCHGAMISFNIQLSEPAPFLGFIGAYNEVSDYDILLKYTEFYQEFLISRDFDKAFEYFLKVNAVDSKKWHLIDTYELFVKIYKDYVKEKLDPKKNKERAKLALKPYHFINRRERRKKERNFIEVLNNSKQHFYKEHSRKFFMIDLYPENEGRFNLPSNHTDL